MRHLGFAYRDLPADAGYPMLEITYGDVGWRVMAGFHRGVVEMIRAGNSVIIDEMLLDGRVRDDWLQILTPWRPLLVGASAVTRNLLAGKPLVVIGPVSLAGRGDGRTPA